MADTIYMVTLLYGEYGGAVGQTVYVRNATSKQDAVQKAKDALSDKPLGVQSVYTGTYSELDPPEKERFDGDIAIFDPE